VADGKQVWLYDADLNQVTVRAMDGALGATPAALLAGKSLDQDFDLSAQPSANGLDWAVAVPKQKDGAFQSLRIGFRGKVLAEVEVLDGFGQRSLLQFTDVQTNVPISEQTFRFTPPKGAEVLKQP
jgi:outer membrane lipoprotein carrier protein